MSLVEVQSRIAAIEGQLRALDPKPALSGEAFAAALRAAGATAPVGTTTSPAAGAVTSTAPGAVTDASASVSNAAGVSQQPATAAPGATAEGLKVVEEAKKYLGVPYVWGGTDPTKGVDCSGLIQTVYRNLGYEVPRVSYQQATAGRAVSGGLGNAQPGDILAFGHPVNHVGIYVGDNKMIEAPRPGLNVRIADVPSTPTAIRRIVPEAPSVAPATAQGAVARTAGAGLAGYDGTTGVREVPFATLFNAAEQRTGVDASLLAAVARQESAFNPSAVSHAGAQGLMQLMPGTAKGLGVSNSFDPAQAVDGAARLLKDLLTEFGRVDLALAAYNAGPGAVRRYDGIPPYAETQNYVRRIMGSLGVPA